MKKYAEYKDSGVEWIENIPSEWRVIKIKYLATEPDTLFIDGDWIESNVIENEGIRYLTTGNIGTGIFKEQGNGFISVETFNTLKCTKVYPKDLVISRLNEPVGRACLIPDTFSEYIVAVDNVILRPNRDYDKRFLVYFMNTSGYAHEALLTARGTTMTRISRTQLGNLRVVIPPLITQQSIAEYLDQKTSAIDTLIADKQKLIDLLKEKRQAIISEIVTRGLDNTAKMKDSGIKWIGEIPERWEITRIKYITSKIGSGKTPKGGNEVYINEGVVFIRSQNIYDTGLFLDDVVCITDEMDEDLSNTRLEFGDVLLNITGASIGRCCIWNIADCRANVNQHVCIIRATNNIANEYLHYVIISFIGKTLIDLCQSGANRQGLNFEEIANFNIPLPPMNEQLEIIAYLNKKFTAIDALISDITIQIEKLNEYRQSIISEAVTGKVVI